MDASLLGQKLHFRTSGRTARNRFLKAALTERIGTFVPTNPSKHGLPTEAIVNMYSKWGHGGFGIILTGNVMVDERHLESAGNMVIDKIVETKERRALYRRVADAMKSDGALGLVQLNHAGGQTPVSIVKNPFAASSVQSKGMKQGGGFGVPIALSTEQIKTKVIDKFAYAAKYCAELGFDGVEIHAAHGYLLSGFLSPSTNKRTDQYGGSVESRVRIVREIYAKIREVVPKDFVIGLKINSVEFQKDGLETKDSAAMCKILQDDGFDFIELSGGTCERSGFSNPRQSTKVREAYFLDFSEQIIKTLTKTVIYCTGGFRTAAGMIKAVKIGATQGIGIGRPTAQEPDLPIKILSGKSAGARKSLLDPNNYEETTFACNAQMEQMGRQPYDGDCCAGIMDLSDPKTVEQFREEIDKYIKIMLENGRLGKPTHGVIVWGPEPSP